MFVFVRFRSADITVKVSGFIQVDDVSRNWEEVGRIINWEQVVLSLDDEDRFFSRIFLDDGSLYSKSQRLDHKAFCR